MDLFSGLALFPQESTCISFARVVLAGVWSDGPLTPVVTANGSRWDEPFVVPDVALMSVLKAIVRSGKQAVPHSFYLLCKISLS